MVEKTSGWDENKSTTLTGKKSIVGRVLLSQIALNPEERLRLDSGNYKALPKYIGIKSTMEMFGQYHTITLRRKGNKDYLLGGFLRFCIAVELGWKEIGAKTYFDLSDYEAIIIEITENTNRIDFTSYEVIIAMGKAKTEWERLHPSTGRGKYNRSQLKNETISDGESLMQLQNHQYISGFVKENYKILGISKRSLYRRVQIYNAIENNILNEKTIHSFRNEKISYSQLLNKLRKIENKRKIRNKVGSKVFQIIKETPPINEKKEKPEISVANNLSEKVKQVSGKLSHGTHNKSESEGNTHFNGINETTSLHVEIQEKIDRKPSNTIVINKVDNKKSSFLEKLPFDKINPPRQESVVDDDKKEKFVKIKKKIESTTKETISICPHCKKNIIISEDSSEGESVKILLPLYLK